PLDAFRAHGVPMAVATDCNPGTSPLQSLRLAMALACTHFRLTPEEALRGATQHAARALGLDDRGRLAEGLRADFVLWNAKAPAELCYWLSGNLAASAWSGGRQLYGPTRRRVTPETRNAAPGAAFRESCFRQGPYQ